MTKLRQISAKQLGYYLGVHYNTAKKEYKVIQDSLNLNRKLVVADLEQYFGIEVTI